MKFTELNITNALYNALEDLGIQEATTIQEKAYSVVMSGKDVVGLAQTGTGKTFAYLLPILKLHEYSEKRDPTVLIVVPTRELVAQVVEETKKLTAYMTIRIAGVYGGTNINTQKASVIAGIDILVATPGRLVDLALCGALKLRKIRKLVIDEVDEMLSLGFRPQLKNIMDLLPERRQNLMFSATMTDDVEELMNLYFNNPEKIEAAPVGTPLEQIIQKHYLVENFHTKANLLIHLLESDDSFVRVLTFVRNKKQADILFERLNEKFEDQVGLVHSNKSQNYRFNSIQSFQSGQYRLLIATDLVARGLDIANVTHVINIDTPNDPLNYMHRIGRTGRVDKEGIAITFTSEPELVYKQNIEELMKMKTQLVDFPEEVEISEVLTEDEMPEIPEGMRELRIVDNPIVDGAFHEKKDKNKKVNLGGSYRTKIETKYKKPQTKPGGKKGKRK